MNPIKAGEAIITVGEAIAPKSVQAAEGAAQALLRDAGLGNPLETIAGGKLAPTASEEASQLLARAGKPAADLAKMAKSEGSIGFVSLGGGLPEDAAEHFSKILGGVELPKVRIQTITAKSLGSFEPQEVEPWPLTFLDQTARKLGGD